MLSRRDQWLNQMTFARTELKSALASRQVLEWDYLHSALGSERISELGRQLHLLSTDADDLDMAQELQNLFVNPVECLIAKRVSKMDTCFILFSFIIFGLAMGSDEPYE